MSSIPHSWPEVEAEVREAILSMASILQTFGPDDGGQTVTAFLGREMEDCTPSSPRERAEAAALIDPTRHRLHGHVRRAWCYAYQQDGWEAASHEDAYEIGCGLLNGYPQTDFESSPNGLAPTGDPPLRRVLETFLARWDWAEEGNDLTVRQLALLSGMTEPTVRSSLSKEGFRLDKPDTEKDVLNTLDAEAAGRWLSRRRGFIPNRKGMSPELRRSIGFTLLEDKALSFPEALDQLLSLAGRTVLEVAADCSADPVWLGGLSDGKSVVPDLAALKRLADCLEVPRATFVGRAVTHLVALERPEPAVP